MTLRTDVSVLYVDPRGPYPKLVADWWDEARDARNYSGPNPVVAHPPCGAWGDMAHLYTRLDKDLAPIAVDQVRQFGGVLEHPRNSKLIDAMRLPRPGELPDVAGGTTWDVEQVSWGHVCRKPTRLYFVRVPRSLIASTLRFGGDPTHQIWGSKRSPRHRALKGTHTALRRRTPVAFAEWLIELAAQARRP